MKSARIILLVLLSALPAFSASWYFDNAAVGANNGTSWTDAWSGTNTLNWTSIAAGDTLYISGGTTGKVYTQAMYMPGSKSGTAADWITISVGQDAGHNGVAIFEAVGMGPGTGNRYVHLNGGRSASFVNPTNHQQVMSGSTAITNNIGIRLQNKLGTTTLSDTDPVMWYFTSAPKDLTFSYVEVLGMSNTLCGGGCDWKGTVFMVNGASDSPTNVNFQYIYFHDNTCQQFQSSSLDSGRFDDVVVKFSAVLGGGEDYFEIGGGGWTVRDSILGESKGYGKIHADMFQFTGNNMKVYNNDIREISHSLLRIQTYPDEPTLGLRGNIYYFNNIVTEKLGRTVDGGLRVEQLGIVHYDPDNPATNVTVTNVVFANNLFYKAVSNWVGTSQLALSPLITFSKGNVTNAWIKNSKWVNNIVIDRQEGLNFPSTTNVGVSGYIPYTTNDLWVDYNIQWATNTQLTAPLRVNYMDGSYTNDASNPFKFSNKTNAPVFVDVGNDNFELGAADTAALNQGFNMSSYFNFDALNRARNVAGAWDIGPLEFQETNLVVFLSFETDTAGGNALDSSGNGNNGYTNFFSANLYPTNVTASGAANTVFRPNITGTAKDFKWHTNNGAYGFYLRDGGSYGITNISRLTNMTQATIMVWARYQPATRTDLAGADYSSDGNATLLSAGTATGSVGSWDMGRFNNNLWRNNTRFMIATGSLAGPINGSAGDRVFGTSGRFTINFPDIGDVNAGNTTNWYHYAVTFSNGVVKGYFNASAWTTNDISNITNRLHIGRGAGRPYDYIGVGVNTHVGSPAYEDETGTDYPNHGFMNGALDQVRIYDRALSWQEIVDVANSEGAEFADAPAPSEPEAPTAFTRSIHTGKQVSSGKVVRQ